MELLGVGKKSVQIKNDRCDHRLKPIIFMSSSRPFDSSLGLGRGLLLRIPSDGRTRRCHGLARGTAPNQNQRIENLSQRHLDDDEAGKEDHHGI
jgi:hypothetical protein